MLRFLSPSRLLPPLRPLRRPRLIRTLLFKPLFLLPLQPVGWLALRDLAHLLLAPAPLRRRALDPELRRSLAPPPLLPRGGARPRVPLRGGADARAVVVARVHGVVVKCSCCAGSTRDAPLYLGGVDGGRSSERPQVCHSERRLPRWEENMLPGCEREGARDGGQRELLTLLATCIRDADHCNQ